MVWSIPTVFVGEFDSQAGPRVNYAFQYYSFCANTSNRSQLLAFSMMEGDVVVGQHVASGALRESLSDYVKSIAARALATSDTTHDCIMSCDPAVGTIASYSFQIADILARGEKRKLCLIVTHPRAEDVLCRWSLIMSLFNGVAQRWIDAAEARVGREYQQFPDLSRMREEARKKPLRSFLTLVAGEGSTDLDTLLDVHVALDAALPRIFGLSRPQFCITKGFTSSLDRNMIPFNGSAFAELRSSTMKVIASEGLARSTAASKVVCLSTSIPLFSSCGGVNDKVVVQPAAGWLRKFHFQDHLLFQPFASKCGKLLTALLTGNQILVSGADENHSADLAFALAQLLPRFLRRVHARSDTYREAYCSRIVAFSDKFLDETEIVHHRDFSARDQFVLSEINSSGVIHAFLYGEKSTLAIDDCDAIISAAQGERLAAPSTPSTLVQRLLLLVHESCIRCSEDAEFGRRRAETTLLQTQLELCVREYVVRGRLYSRMFQSQEVERNQKVLGLAPQGEAQSNEKSLFGRVSKLFSSIGSARGKQSKESGVGAVTHSVHLGVSNELKNSPTAGRDAPRQRTYEKRLSSSLSVTKSAFLEDEDLVHPATATQRLQPTLDWCEAAPSDHAVLTFLGTCRSHF